MKKTKKERRLETPAECIANAVTHGAGLVISIACLVLLVVCAALNKGVWEIVSCSVYGAMLVTLYLASTLYHSVRSLRFQRMLQIIDHAAIYLLIAGTYTPYVLVPLRGRLGWSLFGMIWGLAGLGIVFQAMFINRLKIVSTLSYLAMGWLVAGAIVPLWRALPAGGVFWLIAGGLFYSAGIIFYARKQMMFAHAVWHLFVLAGSLCHFFGILFYVAL